MASLVDIPESDSFLARLIIENEKGTRHRFFISASGTMFISTSAGDGSTSEMVIRHVNTEDLLKFAQLANDEFKKMKTVDKLKGKL